MELLLHPPDDAARHRPDGRGRLSTVGHRAAFRAFARAAKRAGIEFMVIGGTFRDVAVRAASTTDCGRRPLRPTHDAHDECRWVSR